MASDKPPLKQEESMGEGGSDAAAVEVDGASALAAQEDDAPVGASQYQSVQQAGRCRRSKGSPSP